MLKYLQIYKTYSWISFLPSTNCSETNMLTHLHSTAAITCLCTLIKTTQTGYYGASMRNIYFTVRSHFSSHISWKAIWLHRSAKILLAYTYKRPEFIEALRHYYTVWLSKKKEKVIKPTPPKKQKTTSKIFIKQTWVFKNHLEGVKVP